MSQSIRPTRPPGWPFSASICASAHARLTANVDFPTPPFPLAMAIACLIRSDALLPAAFPPVAAPGARGGATARSTLTSFTPGMARSTRSTSAFSAAGMLGSAVVRLRRTVAVPSTIAAERTMPNDTMSRLNPGYFTCLSASLIVSDVTVVRWWIRSPQAGTGSAPETAKRGITLCRRRGL